VEVQSTLQTPTVNGRLLLCVGFFPYWLIHNRYVKGVLKDKSRQWDVS
jgi:hypothetical protein